jgi:hypothetical protein
MFTKDLILHKLLRIVEQLGQQVTSKVCPSSEPRSRLTLRCLSGSSEQISAWMKEKLDITGYIPQVPFLPSPSLAGDGLSHDQFLHEIHEAMDSRDDQDCLSVSLF